MTIGIAAPTPSGIPGFNIAGSYASTGRAVGVINAQPLPGWFNIVRDVRVADGPVSLPPATCGGQEVVVWNYPLPGNPTHALRVFGNVNPYGTQDTVANASGVQGVGGVSIPTNTVALFWVMNPQSGFTNAWTAGAWNYRILEAGE